FPDVLSHITTSASAYNLRAKTSSTGELTLKVGCMAVSRFELLASVFQSQSLPSMTVTSESRSIWIRLAHDNRSPQPAMGEAGNTEPGESATIAIERPRLRVGEPGRSGDGIQDIQDH